MNKLEVLPKGNKRSAFIDRILYYANNDAHGYSQKPPSGRWGPDFDCSSLIYQAASDAGYHVGSGSDKVRFTGTMLKDFEKAGFQILPFANVGISDLEIGDILLNLALHAEVYVGNGESASANSSENGGYVGESGDQTGHEIDKHPVITFDKDWDYILRPPDEEDIKSTEYNEEGDNTMPMNYSGQTPGMQNAGGWQNGFQQGAMMNRPMLAGQGYPQGNLGQMNGYSQANTGGYQQGMMYGGPQGQSYQMETDYCFVKGIEGARNSYGIPNSRKPLFDEDKSIFYAVTYGPQGTPIDIHPYKFMDDFESMEEIPQHLSPLIRGQNSSMGIQNGMMQPTDYITREEFEELKAMISGESVKTTNESNGGTPNKQSAGSRLNARTS